MITQFLNWLKSLKQRNSTGLVDDPRPLAQKNLDFLHEERVITAPAGPFDNAKITDSPFPNLDQHQTLSCVPHGVGLALAIERKVDTGVYQSVAPMFPYRLRSNFPGGGSYPQEIFSIYKNFGAPLYTTLPTPLTEAEANAIGITNNERAEAKIFAGKSYFTVKVPNNIDTLAQIAQLGHAVPVCFFSTQSEWSRQYPVILVPSLTSQSPMANIKHEVCILPNSGFTENGIKYVVIQDSALFGGISLRYVPEDFIAARVYDAGYWDTVAVIGSGPRPQHQFTKTLTYGMNNTEVQWLQKLLISEGFLPSDCATGYFGGATLGALHAFQNKYAADILVPLKLDAPTDTFGSMSISKANQLCV